MLSISTDFMHVDESNAIAFIISLKLKSFRLISIILVRLRKPDDEVQGSSE